MSDNVKIVHDNIHALENQALIADALAYDLLAVGLEKPAKRLLAIADSVRLATKAIDQAMQADLYQRVQEAQQSSVNVLNAALAGIAVAQSVDPALSK